MQAQALWRRARATARLQKGAALAVVGHMSMVYRYMALQRGTQPPMPPVP